MLKIALQAGAMKPAVMKLFEDAYLPIKQVTEASFEGKGEDFTARFMKSSSIPEEVVNKNFDCGITGQDVILQSGLEEAVEEITKLSLSRRSDQSTRVVLAGLKGTEFIGKVTIFCDREYSRLAEQLIQISSQVLINLKLMDGTSEEKVRGPKDFAIVATETGSSLEANNMRSFRILFVSQMVLFTRKGLQCEDSQKFSAVEELGWLLRGVVEARPRVLLKMNVEEENLKMVLAFLPSLRDPTVSRLSHGGWAVETVCLTSTIASLIPQLKRAGASGILLQDLKLVVL